MTQETRVGSEYARVCFELEIGHRSGPDPRADRSGAAAWVASFTIAVVAASIAWLCVSGQVIAQPNEEHDCQPKEHASQTDISGIEHDVANFGGPLPDQKCADEYARAKIANHSDGRFEQLVEPLVGRRVLIGQRGKAPENGQGDRDRESDFHGESPLFGVLP